MMECYTFHMLNEHIEVCVGYAYRPIEAVAVVVQLSAFLQKVKLDPVVEPRHFSSLDLTCHRMCFLIIMKTLFGAKHLCFLEEMCTVLTCKDVFKAAGVLLVVVARVQTKPHHLQVLKELFL